MIMIPAFSWFREGNSFSGSSGTDPAKGALCTRTFHYRLDILPEENGDSIIEATCRAENPWPEGNDPDSRRSSRFPLTEDGLEEAKTWLAGQEKILLNK